MIVGPYLAEVLQCWPSRGRLGRELAHQSSGVAGRRALRQSSPIFLEASERTRHLGACRPQNAVVLVALVLAALVLAAGLTGRYGMTGAVTLAAISLAWLVVNGPMEGPVLLVVTRGHGLTGGDLAGLAGLGLAMFQGTRAHRARLTT